MRVGVVEKGEDVCAKKMQPNLIDTFVFTTASACVGVCVCSVLRPFF